MNKWKMSSGQSTKDSVAFFLAGSKEGVKATRMDSGTIVTEDAKTEVQSSAIKTLLVIIFFCFAFRLVFYSILKMTGLVYHVPSVFYCLLYALAMFVVGGNKETRRHHGAEHKVANWYSKHDHQAILFTSVEHIQKSSRIHSQCGTNLFAAYVTFYVISSVSLSCFNFHIPEAITAFAPLFLYGVFPFNFLGLLSQLITTAPPKRDHIEVALTAMQGVVKKEKQKEEAARAMVEAFIKMFEPK